MNFRNRNRWYKEAEYRLRAYPEMKLSVAAMEEELQHLRRCESLRSAMTEQGAKPNRQTACSRLLMEEQLKLVRTQIANVEQALNMLEPEEQLMLRRFYLSGKPMSETAFDLSDELHLEVSTIYAHRRNALAHFSMVLFGDAA